MKRSAVAAVVMALLAGCTTIREMREHEPSATYTSARSTAALEACLAGNLSWISSPAIIHGERSTELSFGEGENSVVMVTLVPVDGGTRVEAREQLAYGARVRHNIEACVSGADR
jgi:hypothetical protein